MSQSTNRKLAYSVEPASCGASHSEGIKTLRPYQQEMYTNVLANLVEPAQTKIPLIGMATGGGKTFTAYSIMAAYLRLNPEARILVLAHNLKILRKNFQNEGLTTASSTTARCSGPT